MVLCSQINILVFWVSVWLRKTTKTSSDDHPMISNFIFYHCYKYRSFNHIFRAQNNVQQSDIIWSIYEISEKRVLFIFSTILSPTIWTRHMPAMQVTSFNLSEKSVCVCVHVCLPQRLLITSSMIWTPIWLIKQVLQLYSYMTAVVGIISKSSLRNEVYLRK